ncbi:response regulator transcription factor [Nitrosomonas sp. Is35]|jgi:two-component system OmpR family response regulator|uniref:response regulator transcription factor n=1 Tax=unclassified Nitrosomonas TaxID=2609265 RepID=UPI00294AACCA|nr:MULTISPECIES: response regulator transcription factor [unclassified Nitrosomonas]MDV6342460.1 response regulator transcription factor [Nitrosomonas sp. Is24]MDV6348364.1 response regulator transcription factor [Nitrosomonas sp. Is35]
MNSIKFLILVIEDEDELREGICELIEHFGYEAIPAKTGVEGLKLLLQKIPDVVLCDIMLPDMDGYEVLRRMKEIPHSAFNSKVSVLSTAFIFLTAKATHADIRVGMNLGADDYICKPFSKEELFNSIHARLEKLKELRKLQMYESIRANQDQVVFNEKLDVLTKKEAYIFDLIARGYTSEEIARTLFLSRRTIENHRNNISRKLNLSGPNSLVGFAIRAKLSKTLN